MWGHFNGKKTTAKVLQCGLYWPTLFKDVHLHCKNYAKCQKFGKISRRDMMPLSSIIIVEIFDVWGIDFMRPFSYSFGNEYILLTIYYVSKWVEVVPTRTTDN